MSVIIVISEFCRCQDVGEGWWEAKNEHGQRGLVPEAYFEVYTVLVVLESIFNHMPSPLFFIFVSITVTATTTTTTRQHWIQRITSTAETNA